MDEVSGLLQRLAHALALLALFCGLGGLPIFFDTASRLDWMSVSSGFVYSDPLVIACFEYSIFGPTISNPEQIGKS